MKAEPNVEAKLRSKLDAIEKRQSELKVEMSKLDQDIADIELHAQGRQDSILCWICQFFQRGWRTLGIFFAVSLVLIPVIIAITITSVRGMVSIEFQVSVLLGAFAILAIAAALHYKGFGILVTFFTVAVGFAIGSIWTDDPASRWKLISAGLSMLGLGVAFQSFNSGSTVNDQLKEIKRELEEINQKVTKPTVGAEQQPIDVEKKPQADK